jgi:hypothetical protein
MGISRDERDGGGERKVGTEWQVCWGVGRGQDAERTVGFGSVPLAVKP